MLPWTTDSRSPPAARNATVGVPLAAASSTARPQPSLTDGMAKAQELASTRCLVSSSTQPSSSTGILEAEPVHGLAQARLPVALPDHQHLHTWQVGADAGGGPKGELDPLVRHQAAEHADRRVGGPGAAAGSGRAVPLWTTVTAAEATPRPTSSRRVASETAT